MFACDDTLREEETGGKLGIVAGRSHRYGHILSCEANLEGFFYRYVILYPLVVVAPIPQHAKSDVARCLV
jgi:hypothetical protein